MHRPVVNAAVPWSRSAATATAIKPRVSELPQRLTPNLSKWAARPSPAPPAARSWERTRDDPPRFGAGPRAGESSTGSRRPQGDYSQRPTSYGARQETPDYAPRATDYRRDLPPQNAAPSGYPRQSVPPRQSGYPSEYAPRQTEYPRRDAGEFAPRRSPETSAPPVQNAAPYDTSGPRVGWGTASRQHDDAPRRSSYQNQSPQFTSRDGYPPPGLREGSPAFVPRGPGFAPGREQAPYTRDYQQTSTRPQHSGGTDRAPRQGWDQQRTDHRQTVPDQNEYEQGMSPRSAPQEQQHQEPANFGQDAPRSSQSRDAPRWETRKNFKSRGSLLGAEDAVIQGQSRSKTKGLFQPSEMKPRVIKAKKDLTKAVEVYIPSIVTVGTLSKLLKVTLPQLERKMKQAGMSEEASYDHVLTSDYAILLAEEFGRKPIVDDEAAFDIHPAPAHADPSTLPHRPPVVTIMGHVDHGKTTLLDTLRSASVAKGEAGGITQHIGAFSVPVPAASATPDGPQTITFLDTPGHAAFSAMRARGARVTDIIVLVVAADDGVMPQTREVIELIKRDKDVGVVVAVNKVDKESADVDKVQKALMVEGIQVENFGGDVPSVEVSGMTGQGLPTLVETLSAIAEMQDLRAETTGRVEGYVLESKMLKGLGPVATVLVLRGCLKTGSHLICGHTHAKVRVMNDSTGAPVKAAYPGMAITVSGWKELPSAGDEVLEGSEHDIKKALVNRLRAAEAESMLLDVEVINKQRREDRHARELEIEHAAAKKSGAVVAAPEVEVKQGPKELRLVVKGDVSGSVEAVVGALTGIGNHLAVVKVVSTGVGDVSESDLQMAKTAQGMVVAFAVKLSRPMEALAAELHVPVHKSGIIYQLMDEVKARIIELLPKIIEKKVHGEATVLQLFDIAIKGGKTRKVAGSRVTNGMIEKSRNARVMRGGETVFEGAFDTMRHLKKDVTELKKGIECGLSFHGFEDLREGDSIQSFEIIEKPGKL